MFLLTDSEDSDQTESSLGAQVILLVMSYEPRHEKTGFWGLRPVKTQTSLLSYRDYLGS